MRYFDRLPMWARKAVVYGGLAVLGVIIVRIDIAAGHYTVRGVVLSAVWALVILAFAWRDYYVTTRHLRKKKAQRATEVDKKALREKVDP